MFYKLFKDENGNVVDANGEKYLLTECHMAQSKAGTNVGYTEFPSRQAALDFYGVSDIPEDELFPMEGMSNELASN